MAAAPEANTSFANRRPGWHMPSLNLEELQLDSFEPLEQQKGRQPCPKCGKSRSLFCYDCLVPFTATPSIQLPFQLHIITHAAEAPQKATGVHAALLCPNQVHLTRLEALPQLDPSRTVVMFPADDALLPDQLQLEEVSTVVLIDSKWRKARELNAHPTLAGMKRVKLPGNPRSSFWRYHTSETSDEGVCTVEALHHLMRALADRLPQQPESYWDNLLWYYAYQHQLIEKATGQRAEKRKQCEEQGGYTKQKKRLQRQQQQQQQPSSSSQGNGQQQQQQLAAGEAVDTHPQQQEKTQLNSPQQQQQQAEALANAVGEPKQAVPQEQQDRQPLGAASLQPEAAKVEAAQDAAAQEPAAAQSW